MVRWVGEQEGWTRWVQGREKDRHREHEHFDLFLYNPHLVTPLDAKDGGRESLRERGGSMNAL